MEGTFGHVFVKISIRQFLGGGECISRKKCTYADGHIYILTYIEENKPKLFDKGGNKRKERKKKLIDRKPSALHLVHVSYISFLALGSAFWMGEGG